MIPNIRPQALQAREQFIADKKWQSTYEPEPVQADTFLWYSVFHVWF